MRIVADCVAIRVSTCRLGSFAIGGDNLVGVMSFARGMVLRLLDIPRYTDTADIGLELVGRGARGGEIEIPTCNSIVHDLGAYAEILKWLVLNASTNGDAIIQTACLIELLGCRQVDDAAFPWRQRDAAASVDHNIVEDPAEPGAHAIDSTDVQLAGDAAHVTVGAQLSLGW